jgi:hypothetical protein
MSRINPIWTKDIQEYQLKCILARDMSSRISKYIVIISTKIGQYKIGTISKDGSIERHTHQPNIIAEAKSCIDQALEELQDFVAVNGIMDS